jgi:hypothetical protein
MAFDAYNPYMKLVVRASMTEDEKAYYDGKGAPGHDPTAQINQVIPDAEFSTDADLVIISDRLELFKMNPTVGDVNKHILTRVFEEDKNESK